MKQIKDKKGSHNTKTIKSQHLDPNSILCIYVIWSIANISNAEWQLLTLVTSINFQRMVMLLKDQIG